MGNRPNLLSQLVGILQNLVERVLVNGELGVAILFDAIPFSGFCRFGIGRPWFRELGVVHGQVFKFAVIPLENHSFGFDSVNGGRPPFTESNPNE